MIGFLSVDRGVRLSKKDMYCRIGKYLPPFQETKETVLELGCGPGKYVALLSTLGYKVIGVDPLRFPSWNLLKEKTSALLLDNVYAEHLPFTDRSFSHVTCLATLLYIKDPVRALREIRRVIKPGGKLIVRTVNSENLYTLRTGKKLDPSSKNLFSIGELIALIQKCDFDIEDVFSYGYWPSFWIGFWWYLECVWLPQPVLDLLSKFLRAEHRVNNIVMASCRTQ